MGKIIKIGPIHTTFEAPFLLKIKTEKNIIKDCDIEIGYSHRGIEGLAMKKPYIQVLELVERSCGLCSHTHTLAFCHAVEEIANITPPRRAQFIRVIVAELERLHSHLFWLSSVYHILGFSDIVSSVLQLREGVMKILEAISGNRVMFSLNTFGGVRCDIKSEKDILKLLDELKRPAEKLYEFFDCNIEILNKTKNIGVLKKEEGILLGVVGPTAEASGIKRDIRKDDPYEVYNEIEFAQFTREEGDAFSRIIIHFWEIFEIIKVLEQVIKKMPTGKIKVQGEVKIPIGEAVSRVEAPRGELFYYVRSDGSNVPRRVKIRVPTFANLPAVRLMLLGENIKNLDLVLASIDPCFSCTER